MITGFNHTGFVVNDLDGMVRFYRDTLGLSVIRERDSQAPPEGDHTGIPGAHRYLVFVGKPEGQHLLELVHWIDPPSPKRDEPVRTQLGSAHVAFNVTDLDSVYRELSAAGVRFVTPPRKSVASDGRLSSICYGQDPEGNWLEFIEAH
jgi:catechol 2,3-dioxygenase-like lactoylglutathione lyase family enzyme